MKILIFTEGTIIMHKNAKGMKTKDIIKQVKQKEASVKDYSSYIPINNAVKKLKKWKQQGHILLYLTSRTTKKEVSDIRRVLKKYNFPKGKLLYRKNNEKYNDIAEKVMPDILIEDDCKSIGGKKEMTITHVKPKIKKEIKSIIVNEFKGIEKIPDKITKC